MKSFIASTILFIIVLFLLLFCSNANAQSKNDNTIRVDHVSFEYVATNLIAAGFEIDQLNPQFRYVYSKPRGFKNGWLTVSISVHMEDSTAVITGKYSRGNFLVDQPVIYRPGAMKGSPYEISFEVLKTFAERLSPQLTKTNISYAHL